MSYSHGKGEGRGGHCTLAEYSRNLWGKQADGKPERGNMSSIQ